MKSPLAVLISDVHYNIHTLEVADKAMRMAIDKANELGVRVIVAGDLHDTKANLRGECITAILETFLKANQPPVVIVGNHCKINEKSPPENHALSFLYRHAHVVSHVQWFGQFKSHLIPYYNDSQALKEELSLIPKNKQEFIIMHQGVVGSEMGHYIQDKSAITKDDLAGRRVISGHYHRRQTLSLPEGGRLDYIGNPYTLGYGEANDPQKGFQVLYDDGSLEFIPTNLRKHVVIECWLEPHGMPRTSQKVNSGDLVWVKVFGEAQVLARRNKQFIADELSLTEPFRLDFIPDEIKTAGIRITKNMPKDVVFDKLIDSLTNSDKGRKSKLKTMWRDFSE